MHVIATAGHVDHGKSTLVRCLTGQDPDRLDEEKRRGLTIELGYAWTTLDKAGEVAFVDVPGHERFIPTMLAGVGPVPAVLLVVAADDPWMPQAAEHLAALDALGISHGVVAISRSDLADPAPTMARVEFEVAGTTLAGSCIVPVSGRTGAGLESLRAALAALVGVIPPPDPEADVRLWIDRVFSIAGVGTIVTGTLPAGTVRAGDTLLLRGEGVRVRSIQALGHDTPTVSGVARVALNLAGVSVRDVSRGSTLVTPGAWRDTVDVDVRLRPLHDSGPRPPELPLLHVGATSVSAHFRAWGDDVGRLRLARPLPLRIGDRGLLRDPGTRRTWAVTVLDPMPPDLGRRRGAAKERGRQLAGISGPDLAGEIDRRGIVEADGMRQLGVTVTREGIAEAGATATGDWLVSKTRADDVRRQMETVVAEAQQDAPLDGGVPVSVVAARLGLPSADLVRCLARPPLLIREGRLVNDSSQPLPDRVRSAVEDLRGDLEDAPFNAPSADRLRELALGDRETAAAAKAGLLLRLAPGIVLLPGAAELALPLLSGLPSPFTVGEAAKRLGSTRRVVVPLMEHLHRCHATRRLPDGRHEVIGGDPRH